MRLACLSRKCAVGILQELQMNFIQLSLTPASWTLCRLAAVTAVGQSLGNPNNRLAGGDGDVCGAAQRNANMPQWLR